MEILFTFKNTHYVMLAEKVLLRAGVNVSVLPLPPQISAGCGLCIGMAADEREIAARALAENNVTEFEVYTKMLENGRIVYRDV